MTRTRGRLPKALASLLLAAAAFAALASQALAAPTLTVDPSPTASYATAQVSGTVDPGDTDVYYFFQYSKDPASEGWTGGAFQGPLAANSGVTNVTDTFSGLKADTEYKLRLATLKTDFTTETVSEPPYVTFTTEPVAAPDITLDPVTTFTGTTAHLNGEINPNAPEAAPTSADVEAGFKVNWHFECTPACPGLSGGTVAADETGHAVTADATGLEPNTHYEVKLVGTNAGGPATAGPVTFTTSAVAPSATTVPAFVLEGGTRALIGAKVNPHNSATSYWFEYGTDASYGHSVPVPHAGVGADNEAHFESQEITGLAPATTYHFRVVAEGGSGAPARGEDVTFTTPSPAGPAQSCPNEQFRTGPSARLPECRAYELVSPPDLGGSSARAVNTSAGSQPWSSVSPGGDAAMWNTDAVPPGDDSNGSGDAYVSRRGPGGWTSTHVGPPGNLTEGYEPVFGTPNLDRIIWFTPQASLPGDDGPINPNRQRAQDYYREEPDGSFVHINQGSAPSPASQEILSFGGASSDGLHVFFSDTRGLEPGANPFNTNYERAQQKTTIVGRDENGVVVEGSSPTGVSDDASSTAFASPDVLYLYRNSVLVAQFPRTDSKGTGAGFSFEGFSADGSRAFFTDLPSLTPDDEDTSVDLYEYDLETEDLTRLSAPSTSPAGPGPGNSDDCAVSFARQCGVAGVTVSRDGSAVYFVSPERLDGASGVEGGANLYLRKDGLTRYVATLDPNDPAFGAPFSSHSGTSTRHANLTPDGSGLLFESRARLTAYDNAGRMEVYIYDSSADSLSCVSCRPSGEAPAGAASLREVPESSPPSFEFSEPPMDPANSDEHGGRIFFQSNDALVPRDHNGKVDIYEKNLATGVVSLISSGEGNTDSAYLGSGADGRDVFFFANDALAPQERSTGAYKLYDARIGGGFPAAVPPAPLCGGETCRGQGSASAATRAATTSTFSGPGNPAPQAKKAKHRRHKQKHRKHRRRHAKRRGGTAHHKGKGKHRPRHGKHTHKNHDLRANRNGRTGR